MKIPANRPPPLDTAERYRTLLEVNNAIVSNLTRAALFRAVAAALGRVLPYDRTGIFLHDPARDVLTLYMLEAPTPSAYFAVGFEMPAGESHVGWVFRNARPMVRRDLPAQAEFELERSAVAEGIRSGRSSCPFLLRGRAIGTLAVASNTPAQYGPDEVALLEQLAGQVALAVENMRAHEELAARAAANARLLAEVEELKNRLQRRSSTSRRRSAGAQLRRDRRQTRPRCTRSLRQSREGRADRRHACSITGETGTGKELIARAIHDARARARAGRSSPSTARRSRRASSRASSSGTRRARSPAPSSAARPLRARRRRHALPRRDRRAARSSCR